MTSEPQAPESYLAGKMFLGELIRLGQRERGDERQKQAHEMTCFHSDLQTSEHWALPYHCTITVKFVLLVTLPEVAVTVAV
jgi:hypothetical protein